jgi:SAM-dependent methyltransferase
MQFVDDDHSGDPWARFASLEQLKSHDIWWLRRAFLARLWPSVEGLRVLEVGSGPAHDSLVFAERGARVTALDFSAHGLRAAKRFYGDLGLPIECVQSDATHCPFADASFDLAFNAGVLEHFADDRLEMVIDEMIRVVRPGGHVLAFCPNRYNVFYQFHLRRTGDRQYEFERAFTATEMRRRFEARGLKRTFVSGVHVHPAPNFLLPRWLPKHHKIEPVCRSCFSWLESAQGLDRIKSFIGQDFVVWAQVPAHLGHRTPLARLGDGQCAKASLNAQEQNGL